MLLLIVDSSTKGMCIEKEKVQVYELESNSTQKLAQIHSAEALKQSVFAVVIELLCSQR